MTNDHTLHRSSLLGSALRLFAVAATVATVGVFGVIATETVGTTHAAEPKAADTAEAVETAVESSDDHAVDASPALAVEEQVELIVETDDVIDTEDVAVAQPSVRYRQMLMEVTAYCACKKCCGPNAQGITASGKLVDYNGGKFVAADTSLLPFYTKLHIPGYDADFVEVIDRGGAIKGNRLDLYFDTHEEALEWGRQKVWVTVAEEIE